VLVALGTALFGCGDRTGLIVPEAVESAGADASRLDASAGPADSGAEAVADALADSLADATRADAGVEDGGLEDAVLEDGELDAGLPDAPEDDAACSCPVGFVCDPALGCTAGAYAVSPSALYTADLPSGTIQTVGSTSIEMFDIALAANGVLYGIDGVSNLYVLDTATASATMIASLGQTMNGLEAAPDGTLYAAGIVGMLYAVEPTTGKQTPLVTYPAGYGPSGDLAIVQGTVFGTAAGRGVVKDVLVAFDLATRKATIVGSTGFTCIYGLAAHGASLFGFTCNGEVLSLDTATGRGTLLATPGPSFYGATAR
jgi:hypothetical protein